MNLSKREFEALLRNDLPSFIHRCFLQLNPDTAYQDNWHIDVIAAKLEACRRGEILRLIINIPPRSLKSICASIAFPAWLLGHNPSKQILCASYGQDLANRLAFDCRTVMMAPWYQALFPTRLASIRPSVSDFMTTKQGGRLATSVGGVVTGRGADFIIIDDPLKPDEALSKTQRENVNNWFNHTILSRLNNKKTGCIIIIMQRLHMDDLVGHVLAQGEWEVVSLPAIAEQPEYFSVDTLFGLKNFSRMPGDLLHPEREPQSVLEQLRNDQGEYHFAGQYQQAPTPLGGGLVKEDWLRYYEPEEMPEKYEQIVQSWDTASKETELSDFSVCTTWGIHKKKSYLLDVFRGRLNFPALKRMVIEQAKTHTPNIILIEDKASGTPLIQELREAGLSSVKAFKPEGSKTMRMNAQTAQIEGGFVLFPRRASWLPLYLAELTTFPMAKHDDQVDSTSQALRWIQSDSEESGLFKIYRENSERKMGIRS